MLHLKVLVSNVQMSTDSFYTMVKINVLKKAVFIFSRAINMSNKCDCYLLSKNVSINTCK